MTKSLEQEIYQLINNFKLDEAEEKLKAEMLTHPDDDLLPYLLGNIQRKRNNWKEALEYYAQAIEISPDSPAFHAREMIVEIINFYDKERYNV